MNLLVVLAVIGLTIYFVGKDQLRKYRQLVAAERASDIATGKNLNNDRRRWALALADILLIRNGLPHKATTLDLTLPEDKRQQLAERLLKELGIAANENSSSRDRRIKGYLRHWIGGVGQAPTGFYEALAAQGQVRDAIAFDCARTAFLVRCIAGLGWCSHNDAWLVLFLNAQRAQDSFISWQDYGLAYIRARHVWLTLQQTPPQTMIRDRLEIEEYLAKYDSNWKQCSWQELKIFVVEPDLP